MYPPVISTWTADGRNRGRTDCYFLMEPMDEANATDLSVSLAHGGSVADHGRKAEEIIGLK